MDWVGKGAGGIAAALTVVAAGCTGAANQGVEVLFDACVPTRLALVGDVPTEERHAVVLAVAMWRAVGGPKLALDEGNDVDEGAPAQILPIGFEDVQAGVSPFFGVYRPARGEITIARGLPDTLARAITVAHEIGHAFGLAHSDSPSVMVPGNLAIPPLVEDVRHLRDVQGECPAP